MCINVSPPPSPPLMRSEPLAKHLQMGLTDIIILIILCMCLAMLVLSNVDLDCRFIPFDIRLNTLTVSLKANKTANLPIVLCFLSYLLLFDYYCIVFLPHEFWNAVLNVRRFTKKSVVFAKMFHTVIVTTITGVCYRLTNLSIIIVIYSYNYPLETFAFWVFLLCLVLCPDIHPNPGPTHSNNFAGGFLSFCNWNLNTLSKANFSRITLLEAHNTEHNYDIISLCETSLDDTVEVPVMCGYKFHSCNHPDGNRSGGLGIFYRESSVL